MGIESYFAFCINVVDVIFLPLARYPTASKSARSEMMSKKLLVNCAVVVYGESVAMARSETTS